MTIREANQQLDALRALPGNVQEVIIAEGRAFLTHMTRNRVLYAGILITTKGRDFDQADQVAEERGWGETVQGCIEAIISSDMPAAPEINLN